MTFSPATSSNFDFPDNGVEAKFDRVISIEMFAHMRNYAPLLQKISRWLKPNGLSDAAVPCSLAHVLHGVAELFG